MQVFDMTITRLAADDPGPWHGKFTLSVGGCGFYEGANPWMMRIGDQGSSEIYGGQDSLTWSLEKEPALDDELFVGYGAPEMATGIRYSGLGKTAVAPFCNATTPATLRTP